MLTDNEIHSEVIEDGNISPDIFREMFGEITASNAMNVSIQLGIELFDAAGWKWTKDMDSIVKIMFGVALNPQMAEEILTKASGYAQYVMTLYLKADAEYRKDYNQSFPNIVRGERDKAMAQLEAVTSTSRNLKNYLRNTYYNLTRTANAAQSLLRMHANEPRI